MRFHIMSACRLTIARCLNRDAQGADLLLSWNLGDSIEADFNLRFITPNWSRDTQSAIQTFPLCSIMTEPWQYHPAKGIKRWTNIDLCIIASRVADCLAVRHHQWDMADTRVIHAICLAGETDYDSQYYEYVLSKQHTYKSPTSTDHGTWRINSDVICDLQDISIVTQKAFVKCRSGRGATASVTTKPQTERCLWCLCHLYRFQNLLLDHADRNPIKWIRSYDAHGTTKDKRHGKFH